MLKRGTHVVGLQVGGNLGLGAITVGEQLFLVVQEFFTGLGRVFGVLSCKVSLLHAESGTIKHCAHGYSRSNTTRHEVQWAKTHSQQ